MKKGLKIFIEIVIVLLLVLCITMGVIYINSIKNYNNREIKQFSFTSKSLNETFEQNNSIELENLSVQLSKIAYSSDSKELSVTTNFEGNLQNSYLDIKSLDYIIFDQDDNILNTSIWGNLNKNKNYARGFVNEKYGQKIFSNITSHFSFNEINVHDNIEENQNIVSKTFSSSLKQDISNIKKLTIRLFNIKYNFENKEYSLPDTDLEFVLSFE